MVESYDVGSMPLKISQREFSEIFHAFEKQTNEELSKKFEEVVVQAFVDKILAGINIPNYPQFCDMSEMFLSRMDGIEKFKEGYVEIESLRLKPEKAKIPEVLAIEKCSKAIFDRIGESFRLKVCITGPYTLANFFPYRNEETFRNLGRVLAEIVRKNIFKNKFGQVYMVTLDEPLFGVISDPMMDYGSPGRDALLKAWEKIFSEVSAKGIVTSLHLHSTADELFWYVKCLKVVESHVNDQLYERKANQKKLEEYDKFLKASICLTDFDQLIRNYIIQSSRSRQIEICEKTAEIWKKIHKGTLNSNIFLEEENLMKNRLEKIVETFGIGRVIYAGPECGLGGFPSYETAIEYLRRVANAVKNFRV
jgi:5-methyltetrahydropteroyltriglutamate--homocysteine methyltransferase